MEKGVLAKGASVFLMKNNMNIKKGTLNRKVIEALGKKGIIVKWQNGNSVD
jgi:hypothetical protein